MKKVIIVDDELYFAKNVANALQQMNAEWQVMAVKDNDDVLRELESSHVDIVVTDIKLPSMNGVKLAETIKARWPDVALIMMTASGTEEIVKLAFNTGALFYIEKPFRIENLGNMIAMAGLKKIKKTVIKQQQPAV